MPLIAIMGPMTGDRSASGDLAFYFLTACVTLAVTFLSIWWQSRKPPRNNQRDRDTRDERTADRVVGHITA